MPRVVISGYFGLGNAGDEAVLAATVAMLRARLPGVEPVALTADPLTTNALHGIAGVPRMAPRRLLAALRGADLLLSGGGSLLQDATSLRSLLYYLAVLAVAQRVGCRTMVFAQGIGPLRRPVSRRLVRRVVDRVEAVTVRDEASAALLREVGVRRPPIEVTADPVFALAPVEAPIAPPPGRPRIAVALRPWPGAEGAAQAVAAALPAGASVQIWPLHLPYDLPVARELASRLPAARLIDVPLRPAQWIGLARTVDVVVAARLHALIFAAVAGVAAVAIDYDPKVAALRERLGLPDGGPLTTLDPKRLAAAIGAAKPPALEGVAALADAARRNVEIAASLLPAA